MRPTVLIAVVCLLTTTSVIAQSGYGDVMGKRGDANNDQSVNMSDIVYLSSYLYEGGDAPPCLNQADANDDGAVNGSDAIFLSNWLFAKGAEPPAPGPKNPLCDPDPTGPFLGCEQTYCADD